jgi:hypothetical protein
VPTPTQRRVERELHEHSSSVACGGWDPTYFLAFWECVLPISFCYSFSNLSINAASFSYSICVRPRNTVPHNPSYLTNIHSNFPPRMFRLRSSTKTILKPLLIDMWLNPQLLFLSIASNHRSCFPSDGGVEVEARTADFYRQGAVSLHFLVCLGFSTPIPPE